MRQIIYIILLLFVCTNAPADIDFPKPAGYVNDFAGVLDTEEEETLTNIAEKLENDTSSEIAIVTIKTTKPITIEEYSVKLFEKWGIGKKDKNNGVLLLAAIDDRTVKIEVGYGLEGTLPDGLCGEIIRNFIIPEFKNRQYGIGIIKGIDEIAAIVSGENTGITNYKERRETAKNRGINPFVLIFFIIFAISILQILFPPRRHGMRSRTYGNTGSWTGYSGGGSFGGFGGGGFGGFGGGHSGGGGAVGRW